VSYFEGVNIVQVADTKRALAFITNRFYGYPSKGVNVVGVTGTNGKTTVTHMIHHVYKQLEQDSVLIGTLGILDIGGNYTKSDNTTPSNVVLQKIIHNAKSDSKSNVVMEVSSHAIKQQRVSQIDFNAVIFTNLTHDHLDYHGSFEDYKYTKGLLFNALGNQKNDKWAILNSDDEHFPFFLRLCNTNKITYGKGTLADVRAKNIVSKLKMTSFDVCYGDVSTRLDLPMCGEFNISNALACIAYFVSANFDVSTVVSALSNFGGIDGRMEIIQTDKANVLIDYAHTPDGVSKVLNDIRKVHRGELITIVGCGGNRDYDKRSKIGELVTKHSTKAIFTTDNPRNEDPLQIINDMLKGVNKRNFIVIPDRRSAINLAVNLASDDTLIVILGKGHETFQTIGNKRIYFSDREEIMKIIKQ